MAEEEALSEIEANQTPISSDQSESDSSESDEEVIIYQPTKAKRKPAAKTKKEGVRLHEELVRRGFPEAKDIHDYLVAEYTKLHEAGKIEGMSMKDLKKIGMNLAQKMYGVKPKPGNLYVERMRNEID